MAGPDASFVGRVVLELWEDGAGSDAANLALAIDPGLDNNGEPVVDKETLVRRAAQGFYDKVLGES